jgi:hypothetical protein
VFEIKNSTLKKKTWNNCQINIHMTIKKRNFNYVIRKINGSMVCSFAMNDLEIMCDRHLMHDRPFLGK